LPYKIEIVPSAIDELRLISSFRRKVISDAIDQQLVRRPTIATRNRKPLPGISPAFEHVPPVWELRVGDYRVFYDVDEAQRTVWVRAIRFKGPEDRTEDIL
jgi:mRNA-degrading endonuclease RelE of RelBE toxin-antitoxin system